MVNYYTLIGVHEQASDDEVVNACHDITRPPGGITPQSLASRCNLYTVLGVDQKATHKDISHAYEDILLPPDGVTIRRPRDTKLVSRCTTWKCWLQSAYAALIHLTRAYVSIARFSIRKTHR